MSEPPTEPPTDLREQKKARTRARVLEVSLEMFLERGFDATTLEDICSAANISKRTFFRYFADKEELVTPQRAQRIERFRGLLAEADPQQHPFVLFRRVTDVMAAEYTANREQIKIRQQLVDDSPALIAREHEIDRDWEREIARTLLERMPAGPESERQATIMAGAMIGAIRATMRIWHEGGCEGDLGAMGQGVLDSLEKGFG